MTAVASGAVARREKAHLEMRQAILQVARRTISAGGIESLSMRAVARELGYSPAALYEYFPGKEELYRALHLEGSGILNDRMRDALGALGDGASIDEGMKALGRAYRSFAHADPELFRLIFDHKLIDYHPTENEIEVASEAFEIVVATAKRGLERGLLIEMPAEVIATSAWAMVHGFVMLELAGILDNKSGCAPGDRTPHAAVSGDLFFEGVLETLVQGLTRRDPRGATGS